ncbi:MAG: hypothetical protein NTZ35_01240 [Ignavibacteriales bacterium]|nr:hypothetical protein [Ignavibacteriales bacterium]
MRKKTLPTRLPRNPFTKTLEQANLTVCEDLPLDSVFEAEPDEHLSSDVLQALSEVKLEFVVGALDSREALFAITFINPMAVFDSHTHSVEQAVNYCFHQTHLELLRIGTEFLQPFERVSLLEWVIQRYVAWKTEYSKYCEQYGYDLADIIFDHRYHFPAVRIVAGRLLQLGVDTSSIFGGLPDRELSMMDSPAFICEKVGEGEWSTEPDGNRAIELTLMLASVPDDKKRPYNRLELDEVTRSKQTVTVTVFGSAGEVNIESEIGIIQANQTFFYGLRGADMATIARGLATYLCLKQIESWLVHSATPTRHDSNGGQ